MHLDIFLALMALIHIGIMIGFFFESGFAGTGIGWIVLWVLIFAVAWVCTWEPQQAGDSYV